MMLIVPATISIDLVLQRQRELRAAAERYRQLYPSPRQRRRARRIPARDEPSSTRPRRRTAHGPGWLSRCRDAALKPF